MLGGASGTGLRILTVSARYPPVLNGYAIQCADTTNALARRGHDVRVLTAAEDPLPGDAGTAPLLARLESAPPEGRPSLHPRFLRMQLARRRAYRQNMAATRAALEQFPADVALIWEFDSIGIGVVRVLQEARVPVVFVVGDYSLGTIMALLGQRGPAPASRARRWLHGVNASQLHLSHLLVVSEDLLRWYQSRGVPAASMRVVPNGIAASRIASEPPPPGTGTRLLLAGRIHPTKGHAVALRALALARRRDGRELRLDIVGTGDASHMRQLATLVRQLDLEACVTFLGYVDRDELFRSYRDYDCVLFPSVWNEPFGLVVIEAMSQGVPVVAFARGGPSEIIRDMVDGVLVEEGTPEALARAIGLLADAPELRRRLALAAIDRVAGAYTLEQQVARIEAELHEVVEATRPSWRAAG